MLSSLSLIVVVVAPEPLRSLIGNVLSAVWIALVLVASWPIPTLVQTLLLMIEETWAASIWPVRTSDSWATGKDVKELGLAPRMFLPPKAGQVVGPLFRPLVCSLETPGFYMYITYPRGDHLGWQSRTGHIIMSHYINVFDINSPIHRYVLEKFSCHCYITLM